MEKVLFVSGGHGVGKTYFCKYLIDRYHFIHHAASKLISRSKEINFSNNKRIEGIPENQDVLIEAIEKLNLNGEVLLLDGHFCLINLDSKVVRVPAHTFKNLSPKGIILLIDTVDNIHSRLNERDGSAALEKDLIEALQSEEINYGTEIAKSLGIPLLLYPVEESFVKVDEFIQKLNI
ncbi:ATP-binding protein [Paenibacillus sp. KN14-4R]|uniref:ATP-binding protein n=1 Tax=Paenibacillus sp. KN14-4R TaxID=3445773 RepID=UPI003F9F71BA